MDAAKNTKLGNGDIAPDFTLPRDGGNMVSLSDFKGQTVVLYFYPKDDTSGCTIEAIDFTNLKAEFDKLGVVIIGVSPDKAKTHDKFKQKHNLDVILVADEEKTTCDDYGVWVEKSMYGKKYMGVERSTFLINKQGKIIETWRKISAKDHAEEVLSKAQKQLK